MVPSNSTGLGLLDSIPQRHSRSLSVKTANGSCVSLLNDDSCCDSRRCSSVPELTPHHSPAPHTSCMHTLTRLPSLSALIEAVNIVSPRPTMYPPYSTSASPAMSSQCCDQPTQKPPAKRKYRCSFPGCEKAFTTSGHLSRHYRIHTGEKNYHCLYPGCASRFSRQDNMMQHYRTHLSPRSRRNRGPLKASSIEVMAHNFALPTQHNSIRHAFHPYAAEQWPF